MSVLLGIDIGGTKIAGGLVDAVTGRVLYQARIPTNAWEGGAAVLTRAVDFARKIREEAGSIPAPVAVGVGAGGQIDPDAGVVISATEVLPGWTGTPLRDAFEEELGLPTAVDNDVNALAMGECRWGAGRGLSHLLYLALGTGVGGAILSNGRLHHGVGGGGGELGHLIVEWDGARCPCGGRGCLEAYASGPALVRLFREAGGDPALDGPAIAERARTEEGDSVARGAVEQAGRMLGRGLVSLANIFAPESIVVGGGLADMGEMLLAPARAVLQEHGLPGVRQTPVILAVLGVDAPLVGAASLALEM